LWSLRCPPQGRENIRVRHRSFRCCLPRRSLGTWK
jgi:hypothetical protein